MNNESLQKKDRVKDEVISIDYNSTSSFFERRAHKYNEENPYSVTMYQDNNPDLVIARNNKELEKLLPELRLDSSSRILDLACGIGRWSDSINGLIEEYCGIDFSPGLIDIAKSRCQKDNRFFFTGQISDFTGVLKQNNHIRTYNRFLLIGMMMYINDSDITRVLNQIIDISDPHSIICIREPIGINNRLTLNEFYSDELKSNYSAIYRTRNELFDMLSDTLIKNGFFIRDENYLFKEDQLNNRKETAQYYIILER